MADVGFEGRVAIITGAGGGLGREHALLLASRGAQIVVNDLGGAVDGTGSSAGPAQKVVEEIEALGGAAVADGSSVATQEGAEAMVKTALDAFGRLDIVINNAGILRDKSFANLTPDLWDPVIAVHLTGAYNVTRAAWPHLREQAYGRIISTSSGAGIFGNFGQANYGAAKMGIVGLTRVWAQEGGKYNIRANAIAPVARTRMTEEILGPLVEKVDPALVAPVVAYLASEDCQVSGEIYSVGAGRVSRIFIAEAPGFFKKDLTVEDVRDNWDTIRGEADYLIPLNVNDEFGRLLMPFLTDEQ
ncbi:MAG TPA: SDR family oxidoreductase [Acidimicrobiia bacterium]|jgi:NAD(P)-dependent dehydrogenase (short-subunit alcohol dehydrogenase family)